MTRSSGAAVDTAASPVARGRARRSHPCCRRRRRGRRSAPATRPRRGTRRGRARRDGGDSRRARRARARCAPPRCRRAGSTARLAGRDIAGSLRARRGVRVVDLVQFEGALGPEPVLGVRSTASTRSRRAGRTGSATGSRGSGSARRSTSASVPRTASRFLNRRRMSPPSAPIHVPWSEKTIDDGRSAARRDRRVQPRQRLQEAAVDIGDLGGIAGLQLRRSSAPSRPASRPATPRGSPTVRGDPSALKTQGGCGLGTWANTNCGPSPDPVRCRREGVEDPVDPVALLRADGVRRDGHRGRGRPATASGPRSRIR